MKKLPRLILAAVTLFALNGGAFAQSAGSPARLEQLLAARPLLNKAITMEEAVAIALKESPAMRGALAEVDAAEGRVGSARAQTRLSVSANTFASGGSNANIVASPLPVQPQQLQALPRDAFINQNLSLMYPLVTGGRLNALVRQASALREAAQAEGEGRRQEVALLTRMAYREILARRAIADVQQARLRENEERLRLDRIRLQQEQIPSYYVQRDEAEVAAARQDVTNAARDVETAAGQLTLVMGVNPASQITVTATEDADTPVAEVIAQIIRSGASTPSSKTVPDDDFSALLRVAETNRPELVAAARRVQGATEGAAATRGTYRPQISLFGMGDAFKAKNQSAFAGVTYGAVASIPLYTGGQRDADLKTADAERRRATSDEEQLALQIAQEVRAALLNLRTAAQNIETAKTGLAAAQEGFRIAELRYQAGRSVVTETLDAQAAQVQAEVKVIQARLDYQNSADQLRRAVGQLNR